MVAPRMEPGMRGRLIPVAEISATDVEAWRELAASAAEPNPFFEPEFILAAEARLGNVRGTVLVVSEDDAGWSACLPAQLGRWRRVVNSVWGLRTPYTFLTTPLVRAGHERERLAALLGTARELSGRSALVLERYAGDGPVADAIGALAQAGELTEALALTHERALLRRRENAGYSELVKKKQRTELRRLHRRLVDAVGELEVLDLSVDPDAPAIFLALEAAGWKGREGTAMASSESDAAFFIEICDRFRANGRLEMLALRAGENVIAMLCNLRSGPGSYSFKIAHDENYSRYSPGIQLEVANFDFFHASGSAWMDSCAEPDNAMINRLWPDRRAIRTSVLAPPGARGRTLKAALSAASAARRRVRRRA